MSVSSLTPVSANTNGPQNSHLPTVGVWLEALGTATPTHSISQTDAATFASPRCQHEESQSRTIQALYRRTFVQRRFSVVLEQDAGPVETRQQFFPHPEAVPLADVPVPAPAPGADPLQTFSPSTAVRMRRYEQFAGQLAVTSATAAFAKSHYRPEHITHLITVTCSGFYAPGFDIALFEHLGLPPTVVRSQIGFMGCHGALNGLRVAQAFAADPNAVILLVAVELCSLHFQYGWNPEQLVANALFADGAAACILAKFVPDGTNPAMVLASEPDSTTQTSDEGAASITDSNNGSGTLRTPSAAWRLLDQFSLVLPNTQEAMSWRIDDHGFVMTLSPMVPELIEQSLADWLRPWLAGWQLTVGDIVHWAVHPGGPRILTAVERALQLPNHALRLSRQVLAEFGNMSSPTILFILERLLPERTSGPTVVLAFGPGLTVEAALFV